MRYDTIEYTELGASAQIATFTPLTSALGEVGRGPAEQHAIIHISPRGEQFQQQYARLAAAEEALMHSALCNGGTAVFKRYFLSDAANQQAEINNKETSPCSVSCIQQPPLNGSKVAVWMYIVHGMDVQDEDTGLVTAEHNGYRHLWMMGMVCDEGMSDSAKQTNKLLQRYVETLQHCGATLADNCIRTWFYVRDVDTQYSGMVRARREFFAAHGLTPHTHFISSTGIGGVPAKQSALIQLGTYALTGFDPAQQHYLYAPTHLNATYEYGVTFERGTRMDYGDRRHVYISGTASINNRGEVVHVGDVVQQTWRMWENVEALLKEAEVTFDDVAQIVVYLRDVADYDTVSRLFAQRFPCTPYLITLAPVCRPAWLIEMECVAIRQQMDTRFRDF